MKLGALSHGWFRVDYAEAPSRTARILDASLIGVGVLIACGSVLFAGVMLTSSAPPGVNGVQYLAIFAQPKRATRPGTPEGVETIDMSPIGAIVSRRPSANREFAIVGAAPGFAWVRFGARVMSVRPGESLPSLGVVRDIRREDNRWVILGVGGTELLSSASAATLLELPSKAPIGHKLVLGGN